MTRQRTAGFALALLGTLLCIGGASPKAHADNVTTLHTFNPLYPPYNDGSDPQAGLILASDGNFYGTTYNGGATGMGTIFKMTPDGAVTILPGSGYSFSGGYTDGAHPAAPLVQGADGNFYGTTSYNTVFKITPSGVLTTLHTLDSSTEEGYTTAGLVQGSDGNFYGTTEGTTAGQYGTIFKITPSGSFTTLHIFTHGYDGAFPQGSLVQAPDGNFYGVTQQGGAYNYGTVFQITPSGTLSTIHTFSTLSPYPNLSNYDGAAPNTGLVLGKDGNFYGSTSAGGPGSSGTMFEIATNGTFTRLANFGATALTLGRDGTIYGATGHWGTNGGSTIFKITPYGSVIPIARVEVGYAFFTITNLCQGSDGRFYFTSLTSPHAGEIDRVDYSPFDFIGDGHADLLFQNPTTGQLSVTSMGGATASSPTTIGNTVPASWKVVGIGDFNQDAQPDIVFQNTTTGQLAVWFMNSTGTAGGAYIYPKQDPAWQVVSVADLNGDGHPDLLFQNSSTSQLAIWYMNGTTAMQAGYIAPTPPAGWKAIGTGDFNGDGKQELLFQNPSTGQLALWFFKGGPSASGAAYITPTQNPAWQAVSIMDLNGDGKADIVFQNKTSGQLAVWYMNGTSASSAAYITPNQLSGWQVVGPH